MARDRRRGNPRTDNVSRRAHARRRDRAAGMGARRGDPRVGDRIGQLTVGGCRRVHADVAPILELRTPFSLALGPRCDRSWKPFARSHCTGERGRQGLSRRDGAVFNGFGPSRIDGIGSGSPHDRVPFDDDHEEFPRAVAHAVAMLRGAGVDGPYGVALGPRCYTGVIETTQKGGYPVLEQLRLITGGPIAWAQAIDGSIVISLRGGDFELTLGKDFDRVRRRRCRARSALSRREPRVPSTHTRSCRSARAPDVNDDGGTHPR